MSSEYIPTDPRLISTIEGFLHGKYVPIRPAPKDIEPGIGGFKVLSFEELTHEDIEDPSKFMALLFLKNAVPFSPIVPPEDIAKDFMADFLMWQSDNIHSYQNGPGENDYIIAQYIRDLTLRDIYQYADEQRNKFRNEAANRKFGFIDGRVIEDQLVYWFNVTKLAHHTSRLSEIDKTS